ncbi:hypothetical protein [Dyella sp. 20L07]|uniref:hypothetical protein n=1 Tax=Dyella sp. 20L07 TaxID=3384240 RepID=UPI003D29F8FD
MKRTTRQRLWLIGGAAVLVSAAAWQWQRDASDAPGTLLKKPPSTVSEITLGIGNSPMEHYTKRDGHWWRTDGAPVRTDDGRLGELSDTAAAEVLSWRPASDFDAAKIGLAPPLAVLSLDGQRLEFGETSVTGPQRYVRVGDRVALISMRYMPRPATSKTLQAQ